MHAVIQWQLKWVSKMLTLKMDIPFIIVIDSTKVYLNNGLERVIFVLCSVLNFFFIEIKFRLGEIHPHVRPGKTTNWGFIIEFMHSLLMGEFRIQTQVTASTSGEFDHLCQSRWLLSSKFWLVQNLKFKIVSLHSKTNPI